MNNRTICQRYYDEQLTDKHASNIFIEGATIYSYGNHFPMAVRINPKLHIWNEDRYSNTTSKHQSYCYPRFDQVPVNTEIAKQWDSSIKYSVDYPTEATIEYLKDKIAYCEGKKSRARTRKDIWQHEIDNYSKALAIVRNL